MDIHVYCDESSINERYMLIGSIWLAKDDIGSLEFRVMEIRKEFNWFHEFKWNKVHKCNISLYKALVDAFFESSADFNCIVIDNSKVDHAKWNEGDKELGFYKFYYTLLTNKMQNGCHYYIFTDDRSNRKKSRLHDLKTYLSISANRLHETVVRSIQPVDSKKMDLIQLTDVLLGAVGFMWNSTDRINSHKTELCRHIEAKGYKLRLPTVPYQRKFNVWKLKLTK